ncbi:MAG: 3-hydroxyacyl-CoA dehydrogenase [Polyangiaceae bacterium]|nr:3-hydroxyacyl-CoA dehydrogenase [Polyangiaceae bacterium]
MVSESKLDQVTVIGAGVLGGQIAWQSAYKGKRVVLYDPFEESLEKSRVARQTYAHIYQNELGASAPEIEKTHARLEETTDFQAAIAEADLVIEAVPEVPEIKVELYQKLGACLSAGCLIATNSSTLLPSQFAKDTGRPEKFCALHFANMIWSLNLAEIMAHESTAPETLRRVTAFAIEIGMVPIPVQKEQSGYVCNSLLVPILVAAQSLVTNGVAVPEVVDRTYMIFNRGCSMGPCGIMDVIGFTTVVNVFRYWGEKSGDQQMLKNADYLQKHFIDQGKLGLLSGGGYYQYPHPIYQSADFLSVPDVAAAGEIAALIHRV